MRSNRKSAELAATTNEHARTDEPTKARAQRAQLTSMVTRVGSDALVRWCDRFSVYAPKARYP
eukprot:4451798-Pleurochrysis_carterae.AAC.1